VRKAAPERARKPVPEAEALLSRSLTAVMKMVGGRGRKREGEGAWLTSGTKPVEPDGKKKALGKGQPEGPGVGFLPG